MFLSTTEPTDDDGNTRNPTKSPCDRYVFNTVLTRAKSLVVVVGSPWILLSIERHMIDLYGDQGKCWSLYLRSCLEHDTLIIPTCVEPNLSSSEKFKHQLALHVGANVQNIQSSRQNYKISDSLSSSAVATNSKSGHRSSNHPTVFTPTQPKSKIHLVNKSLPTNEISLQQISEIEQRTSKEMHQNVTEKKETVFQQSILDMQPPKESIQERSVVQPRSRSKGIKRPLSSKPIPHGQQTNQVDHMKSASNVGSSSISTATMFLKQVPSLPPSDVKVQPKSRSSGNQNHYVTWISVLMMYKLFQVQSCSSTRCHLICQRNGLLWAPRNHLSLFHHNVSMFQQSWISLMQCNIRRPAPRW